MSSEKNLGLVLGLKSSASPRKVFEQIKGSPVLLIQALADLGSEIGSTKRRCGAR